MMLNIIMIKQERGWAQATTELELAEREQTSFPAALARFSCGHTATAFEGTEVGAICAGFLQRVRMQCATVSKLSILFLRGWPRPN
jgi:hypothetical protein